MEKEEAVAVVVEAPKIFHDLAQELDDPMEALAMMILGHAPEIDDDIVLAQVVRSLVNEYNTHYE